MTLKINIREHIGHFLVKKINKKIRKTCLEVQLTADCGRYKVKVSRIYVKSS